jgi:hypothetical protein
MQSSSQASKCRSRSHQSARSTNYLQNKRTTIIVVPDMMCMQIIDLWHTWACSFAPLDHCIAMHLFVCDSELRGARATPLGPYGYGGIAQHCTTTQEKGLAGAGEHCCLFCPLRREVAARVLNRFWIIKQVQ